MNIAILGAGNVGQALAQNLIRLGHQIDFGVPEPQKYRELAEGLGAGIGPVAEVVAKAELVILAVPYAAALDIAESLPDWQGRILIDASNPIAPGFAGLSVGTHTSAGEQVAARAHNARVVKCFNVTGAENMANPGAGEGAVFMPVASDDDAARATVVALAQSMGFDAMDAGPLSAARYLEPFAMTWIHLAYARGHGRHWAFARIQMRG
ncbi:MAG: NAD(P)-binding domain-containing protein [Rhodanobacteraceae bacterium]|nr:NAD(P)-binding domain-containing protein [Xanthomonadales bacterium]MCP5474968.1 NAD(P)-binding domain-containing protein [Rhodanobacteraceae bacterium]